MEANDDPMRITDWSVGGGPYDAPEVRRLSGTLENGKQITTSPIVDANGRSVRTRSGSLYLLGDISTDYLKWMQENNIAYDHEQPIKELRR